MRNLIEGEIDRIVQTLCPNGLVAGMSDVAFRLHMERFARRVASAARSEFISSVRSAEEAAEAWGGISIRRAQAHIKTIHERHGVAARIGRAWLITTDEIERFPPGPVGRPKKRI